MKTGLKRVMNNSVMFSKNNNNNNKNKKKNKKRGYTHSYIRQEEQ